MIAFEVWGHAESAGSKRAFPFHKGGGALGVRVTDDNPKSREWKTLVSFEARNAYKGPPVEGAIRLTLLFEIVRPASHSGKRGLRKSARPHPTTKPDVLKLARAVEDALTGIVYRDDSQIVEEYLKKSYGERARLIVRVEVPL